MQILLMKDSRVSNSSAKCQTCFSWACKWKTLNRQTSKYILACCWTVWQSGISFKHENYDNISKYDIRFTPVNFCLQNQSVSSILQCRLTQIAYMKMYMQLILFCFIFLLEVYFLLKKRKSFQSKQITIVHY